MDVRAARYDDIAVIAEGARAADRAELWASSHSTVAEVLERGLRRSLYSWTVVTDRPVAMAGVIGVTALGDQGVPWMVVTDGVRADVRGFLEISREYVWVMRQSYRQLVNFVDARNLIAIRYLRALRFRAPRSANHSELTHRWPPREA